MCIRDREAIIDRLEGFELVEFLQINIEKILEAALNNDWIDEDNIEDLLDFVGVKD